MLLKLSIQNYAIIDNLEISFSSGMNVITGETGAGKSIIVGALGLILGERADSSSLVNRERKCVIEGIFSAIQKPAVGVFLEEHELDGGDDLVIRREITANGKSRAFINDTPVTLSQLQELSTLLVDLHQQFDIIEVSQSDFQRNVIDALAGNFPLLSGFQQTFHELQQIQKELDRLKTLKQQFDREADYNRFQYAELEELSLRPNELEEIDSELKILANAEGIKSTLNKVHFELEESDQPLVQQLKSVSQQLSNYHSVHPALPELIKRIQATQIELQDIAGDLNRLSSNIGFDPQRIELLNERLNKGYKLQKKHNVKSTEELLHIQAGLEEKLQVILNIDEDIFLKEKQSNEVIDLANKEATVISASRRKELKPFEDKVNKLLKEVGMPNARLKAEMVQISLSTDGIDKIEFLFHANIPSGQKENERTPMQFQPVRKVASGGELSRLMLCIKSLVAKKMDLPTLIFDEIDTGISGEAARQVGTIMKELASERQIICITHQPQIAGKADAHFFVYKEIRKNEVHTNIRQLTVEERITAIARMLSGEKPTAAAIENAREMVN